MTTAEIKSVLMQARTAEQAYRCAKDKVNAYRQLLTGGKTVRYDSDGAAHERDGNPIERAYCCLADYEQEMSSRLADMVDARHNAEALIGRLSDPVEREVLTRRYLMFQRWEDIAQAMSYSRRRVTQIHGNALLNISLNFPINM